MDDGVMTDEATFLRYKFRPRRCNKMPPTRASPILPRFCVHSFMDKKEPGNLFVEDMTRESLIAIAYQVPDKDSTAEEFPKRVGGGNVAETPGRDIDEKYRSKLISISYSPPTNAKVIPILPGKLDG